MAVATQLNNELHAILANDKRCKDYNEFLKKIYASENLDFYFRVQQYKSVDTLPERIEKAQEIYNQFIHEDSETALGDIDSETRQLIESCLDDPPANLFNYLQQRAFMVMAHSTVHTFLEEETRELMAKGSEISPEHQSLLQRLLEVLLAIIHAFTGSSAAPAPEATSG